MASRQPPLISFDDAKESPAHWTLEQEDAFIDIMIEQVMVRNRTTNTFGGTIWKKIRVEFYLITGKKYKIKQFQNKYNLLRKRYRTFTDLKKMPIGFGWDPVLNIAIAPNDVWEKYIKVHPEAKKFRTETCRRYDKLVTIFGDTISTGKEAHASTQDISDSDNDTHDTEDTTSLPIDDAGIDVEEDSGQQRNRRRSRDDTSSGSRRVRSQQSQASELSESIKLLVEASNARTTILAQNFVGENLSVGPYSIPKCIKVLDSIEGLAAPTYLKAVEKFHHIEWRVSFISMPSERRLAWLASLF